MYNEYICQALCTADDTFILVMMRYPLHTSSQAMQVNPMHEQANDKEMTIHWWWTHYLQTVFFDQHEICQQYQ
jgi:hypothetical protein